MEILNNPAGRLHRIFEMYQAHADPNKYIWDTWREVFNADSDSAVMLRLADTASLLTAIEREVGRIARPQMSRVFHTFSESWGQMIWSVDFPLKQAPSPGKGRISEPSLSSLGLLALHLDAMVKGSAIPNDEALADLRTSLEDLMHDLSEQDGIPPDLSRAIFDRLDDIRWALEHVWLTGPEGVQSAIERLMGHLAYHSGEQERTSSWYQRTSDFATKAYVAFTIPGVTVESLEGWKQLAQILPGYGA